MARVSETVSLRAAVERARYAVHASEAVRTDYYANNPAQGYRAKFTPAGLEVAPKSAARPEGRWQVGLSLSALARHDERLEISAGRVTASGQRVTVARTAGSIAVDEWFLNQRTGLEQGVTLSARPLAGDDAPLRLQLAVSGTLVARVSDAHDAVQLVDVAGHAALTYDQLHVTDRTGRSLTSHFEVADGGVSIVVADADAAYPIVVDPTLTQQAQIVASTADPGDHFGSAIAISGDTAVVGAIDEDSITTGVNGNQADNSALTAGAAYVFVRDANGAWTQQAYLKASNTDAGDQFGGSVAISGDTIVVGAEAEDSNAIGINGLQSNNSAAQAGAAYVFVRSGTTWTQQAYLKASNTNARDHFAASVGISGDTIVVGATAEDSAATTVNGNQLDNSANGAGAAYVFVRSSGTWTQQAYLKASNAEGGPSTYGDVFGVSVGISGDSIIVGAAGQFPGGGEDSAATGVNGDQADNTSADSGAAYVFIRSGTTWTQQAYLKASNTGPDDRFGRAVAIDQNTVVVGAMNEDSNATAVGGDQADDSVSNSGAAYVFTRSGSTWTQQAYLKASSVLTGALFGATVGVSGDTVAVGASQNTYVFTRTGSVWSPLTALAGVAASVGVSGDTIAVGSTGFGNGAGVARIYVVAPNQAPVADAGADQFAAATSASGASVTLNGSSSSDPDGDTLTYSWTNDFNGTVLTGAAASITVPFGAHTFTLTASDGSLTATDTVVVTVADSFSIDIVTPPLAGASYYRNAVVPAEFTCSDTADLMASCTSNGANLDTATAGTKTFTVTATNSRGDTSSQSRTYTVLAQSAQTIVFPAPAATVYGGSVTLGATATSGLSVTYTSLTPSVCTVSGVVATTSAAGNCSITASQPGDANWLAATPVTQTFAVLTRSVTATLTANSKVYDGTTAEPSLSLSCALTGVLAGDTANVACTPSAGTFDTPNVGSPRTVSATLTLTGSAAGNYTLGAAGTATPSTTATNAATSTTAAVVYGQPDFVSATANNGGLSATSLSSPRGVAADPAGNIYVVDINNFRVLYFPFGQTTATRVYGQPDFTSGISNNGGVSATSLATVTRLTVDPAGGLYIADSTNNRVLYFPNGSTTPTRVYGQGGSFTTNAPGTSADSFNNAHGIAIDAANNVYIADYLNNRVLFFPAGSTTATRVYGQPDFTSNTANNGGLSATSLSRPNGIRLDTAGNLYVADQNNNRVLMFPVGSTTATRVYGQPDFTTNTPNAGGLSASSINNPPNLAIDGGNNLYVADNGNNRVLFYPSGSTTATVVYGQNGSFTTNTANNGGLGAGSLSGPNSVDLDYAGDIYISDQVNNRVLRFNASAPAITPAPLTITASSSSKAYGTAGSVTPSYSGFVNGETSAALSTPPTCSSAGASPSAAPGTYPTICSSAAADNYSINYVAGTMTVESIPVTATLVAEGKTYDRTTAEPDANISCVVSGVIPADSGNVSCVASDGAFDGKDAGTHAVSATVTLAGSAAGHYTFGASGTSQATSTATTTAEIYPLGIVVNITADNKVYDGTTAAVIHPVAVGVIAPDVVTVSATGTFDTKDVGAAKLVTSSHPVLGGADAANYGVTVAFATTTADITQATAVIVVTPYDVPFDGQSHTAAGVATGVAGENLLSLLHLATTSHTGAGDYPEDVWTFDGDANYAPATGFASDRITKATSTTVVTCDPSATYTGSALEVCTASVSGAGGLTDTVPVTYTNNTNVGTASASATYAGDANHDGSTASATFTVTKAASTTVVTCDPSATYTGSALEVCTASVTGAGGLTDAATVTYTNNTNVGTASASATYPGDANHDGSTASATFAITKATSTTVVTCGPSATYTGSALEVCAASVSGAGGLTDTAAVTYTNNTNVGTASASATYAGDANHDGSTASATFTITKATSTTVVTCDSSATYTGAALEVCAASVTGAGGLTDTAAVTYTNNTNVGTASASATYAGDANHDGSTASATFTITKASSTTVVTCDPSATYTGSALEVCSASVTGAGGLTDTAAVTYTNNTHVGTASASATYAGDANHDSSTASATFEITKASSTTVVTCDPSATYTGAALEVCTASVTGAGGLTNTATVTYTNNTNVGTASASATYAGDADHDGSTATTTFNITKATSTTVVTCDPSATYTGSALEVCTASVTGAGGLTNTATVTYTNNTNVGSASASATYAGDANHDGSTASATFTVTKASSTTVVTCDPSATYTGAALEVCTASVTGAGGLTDTATVTYTNNTNVGTASASATYAGDANHDGSTASATFTITKASSTTVVTCDPSATYTGAALELCTASVTGAGGLTNTATVTYTNNTNVGTASASATYAGDANHDGSTASATFTITKATSTTVVTCGPSATYTGSALEVCTASVSGAGGLTDTAALTYTNNTHVGTASASATYAGDANHDGSTASATFTITKASSMTVVTCDPSATYTGSALEVCAASVTGAGGLTDTAALTYTNNTHVGTASASATYAGDANHDGSTASATFTITKASSTTVVTCDPSATYTGAALEVCAASVTGAGGLTDTATVNYTNNTHVGTATAAATYAGDANHDGSTALATFAITKASSTTVVTCDPSATYTGSALEVCTASVSGAGGLTDTAAVTYTNNTHVGTASASATYAGDANHDGSTASATFTITKAASTTTVTCTPSATYTGSALEVCTASVSGAGGLTDTAAVTYTNNTNVGTASASATYAGDANHDGSMASATFAITKASSTTVVTCDPSATYTGAALEVCTASVSGAGGLTDTVAVTYTNNTHVGTATAAATYAGDANHDGSTASATFDITKASSTTVVTCDPSATYTGAALEVCTASVSGAGGLTDTAAVTYTNNTNVGTASASATYAGDANHDGSTASATFTITKASSTTVVTCDPSATYTGVALEVCTASVSGAGGLTDTATVTYTNNTNVGTASASASYAGDANHDGSTASATFAITKAAISVTANDKTRAALAPNPTFDGTLTGVLGQDGITATYSAPAATLPGTYPIVPALVDPNGRLGNYDVTSVNGTLTVFDADPPALIVPASVTAEATSAAGAAVTFADQVSAIDAVFGVVPVTCAPASGATFPIGDTTVACSAQDGVGNTGAASFVVTVVDTTAPTLSAPDITAVATDAAGIVVEYAPVGHDIVSGDVSGVCSPTSGTLFAIGSHQVSCSATDEAGNVSATATFTVTVLDGVAPIVTVPASIAIEATSAVGATVTFASSSTDNVDETLTTACAPASGSVFGVGDTTVTCTATDAANNVGSASFTVTVGDTTAPTLELPVVAPVVSLTPTIVVNYTATASDAVDGVVAADCSPASGSAFPVGSTVVTCTATDAHNNTATGSFTVKVTDGVAPIVSVSPAGDRTVEATSADGAAVAFTATATDNYDSGLTVTCTPNSGAVFPIGATLVTCHAADAEGNVGSTTFTVTVVDTTQPVLSLPAPITQSTALEAGVAVTFTATSLDAVDGAVAVTCAPASGTTFPVGTTAVHCTASDSRGNTAAGDFTVTVELSENRIGRFVAFSRDSTRLRSKVDVVTGDVGANERRSVNHGHRREDDDGDRDDITVEIGERATLEQATSRVVGDTVSLMSGASVHDVIDNFLLNKRGRILGNTTDSMTIPYLTMPSFPSVAAGTTKIDVAKKKTVTLAAGSYGAVHVGNGGTLILTGGLYQMLSIDVDPSGTIVFSGPSEVRVKTELETGAKSKIILDQRVAGLRASDVVFYVLGSDANCSHSDRDDDGDDNGPASVHIGQQNVVQANIYAANGTLWLKSKTQATGAFIALHVRVGERVTLTLDSAFR